MNKFTSIIPPEFPIPDPPIFKYLSLILSILGSILILSVIGFIIVEFTFDMMGKPLMFGELAQIEREGGTEERKKLDVTAELKEAIARYKLISPKNHTRIPAGPVVVLCTWQAESDPMTELPPLPLNLFVDGFPIPWTMQFGPNTWIAVLKLPPGMHRVESVVFNSEFFVEPKDRTTIEPETVKIIRNWKIHSRHPDAENILQCEQCHSMIDRPDDLVRKRRGLTIGPWKGTESCMQCHAPIQSDRYHQEEIENKDNCVQCHVIHCEP